MRGTLTERFLAKNLQIQPPGAGFIENPEQPADAHPARNRFRMQALDQQSGEQTDHDSSSDISTLRAAVGQANVLTTTLFLNSRTLP